ncbi:MAG TPA: arginine deiminase family protein [Pyrinomonadaceae bacterium]
MPQFTRAIVRPPASTFADGLTRVDLGIPDYNRALHQHQLYCDALSKCGLSLVHLEPIPDFPDSTFVEDTALLTERGAVLTLPGAASRTAEVAAIEPVLREFFSDVRRIDPPGTVDAGDVCEAGNHFFIGLSHRTNEAGARQLANFLNEFGYTSSLIDIRETSNILHLKSGIAFLGDGRLVAIDELAKRQEFRGFEVIRVPSEEDYAANCLLVNGKVLIAAGFPLFEEQLVKLGLDVIALEMSEFQKMDGGLSCLSLRF